MRAVLITRSLLLKKFVTPVLFLAALTIFGTTGYVIIEGYSLFDALYMTIITIGTIGYGEVHPLGTAGRAFTMVLILCSIGLVAYYITVATRMLADGEWARDYKLYKLQKQLRKMENHVIICGYGRNGRQAGEVLRQNGVPFTVIEQANAGNVEIDTDRSDLVLYGDATKDEVLIDAGIFKAKALITSLPDDANNLFVVLTARQLNPNLTIISRASYETSVSKLKIAGATNVIMPDKLGGGHMATLVLIPDVHEFISLLSTQHNENFSITEFTVTKHHTLSGLNLWHKTGVTVLGIKQDDGKYQRNPPPEAKVAKGESLIVMGSRDQLRAALLIV